MDFLNKFDKQQVQKITLIVIAALTVLALVLLLVIIIASVDPTLPGANDLAIHTNYYSESNLSDYTVTEKTYNTGSLILANASHPYTVNKEWIDLVGCSAYMEAQPDATGVGSSDFSLKNYIPWKAMSFSREAMAEAHKMLTDAKNAVNPSEPLTIDAAYDTIKHGQTSFEYNTAMLMLLSDFSSTGETRVALTSEYRAWLDTNAAKYGYIESFEDAYRYVGVAHASTISGNADINTLELYITFLKENTNENNVFIPEGGEYAIYYVSCKAGDTIKVPAQSEYTVSGTNEGGVIVTVKVK